MFEKIYNDNYLLLYRIACKMLNDNDAAQDIVQDTFINLYEKTKNNGYEITNNRNWLSKVIYNKCIDYLRKSKDKTDLKIIEKSSAKNDNIETTETKKLIENALSKLNYKERMIAVLYSEGFSYKEISKITEINFSSVGTTLSRTLKKLKIELTKQGYEMH